MSESDREQLLTEMYGAFNGRDIDGVLRTMSSDVDWPRAFKGDRVEGQEAVRDYWTEQWSEISPTVTPVSFDHRPDDTVAVEVHQVVRDLKGGVLDDGHVLHVYAFDGELAARMDVEAVESD